MKLSNSVKLSFSTLGCPGWTLAQIAENGARYGYDGVELRISGHQHVDPSLCPEERKAIRELFAQQGLAIVALSGYTEFTGDNAEALAQNGEALVQNILLARDLGAAYVRTFHGEDYGVTLQSRKGGGTLIEIKIGFSPGFYFGEL